MEDPTPQIILHIEGLMYTKGIEKRSLEALLSDILEQTDEDTKDLLKLASQGQLQELSLENSPDRDGDITDFKLKSN